MADKQGSRRLFTPVYLDLQCVLFFKTIPPIMPVDFVLRICEDVEKHPARQRSRFVNRLTPMTRIGKASEKGLEEVGRVVLGEHFQLAGEEKEGQLKVERKNFSVSASFGLPIWIST